MITDPNIFTHFEMTQDDLPPDYYLAIGKALYRWSQLEGTIGKIAVSISDPRWLEAVQRLRHRNSFNLTDLLRRIKEAALQCEGNETLLEQFDRAEALFKSRKSLFHSIWGRLTGPERSAVGIQGWSAEDYADFRIVTLTEIGAFAADCASTTRSLLQNAMPFFHGSAAIVVDDADGRTEAWRPARLE